MASTEMADFCQPLFLFPDTNSIKTKVMEDLFFILKRYLKCFWCTVETVMFYKSTLPASGGHPAWPGRRKCAPVTDSLLQMNGLQFTLQGQGYSLLTMTNVQMQQLDHSSERLTSNTSARLDCHVSWEWRKGLPKYLFLRLQKSGIAVNTETEEDAEVWIKNTQSS